MSANEASAVGSLQAIKSAEVTYYKTYPTVGFSPDIGSLGGRVPCTPSSTTACLLDSVLSAATPGSNGKSGFFFLATGIIPEGRPPTRHLLRGGAYADELHGQSRLLLHQRRCSAVENGQRGRRSG